MRSLSAYAMRGRWQAVAVVFGFALASLLLPPLNLLSTAMLALVVLRKGAGESAWVLMFSALAVGGVGLLLGGSPWESILYGLVLWAPVWPIAAILRATRRLDWAMEAAVVLGLSAVALVYGIVDDPSALWRERVKSFVEAMSASAQTDFDADAMVKSVDIYSHYMTGAMVGGSVLSLILGLLIGRWQQAVLYNPGGFSSEFLSLRFSTGPVLAALGCIALGVLGTGSWPEIVWNMSIVFSVLFLLGGLSIIHTVLAGRSFWMVGFYMALLIIPKLLLPPIALLGLSDAWLDWRKFARWI